jgi:hypothetical protein
VVVTLTAITTTNVDTVTVTGTPIDLGMVTMERNICMVENIIFIMVIVIIMVTTIMILVFKLLFVDLWNLKIG